MPKMDIATTISAADGLLETSENPLHRQILENYRRHAILDICGEREGIFDADMMPLLRPLPAFASAEAR